MSGENKNKTTHEEKSQHAERKAPSSHPFCNCCGHILFSRRHAARHLLLLLLLPSEEFLRVDASEAWVLQVHLLRHPFHQVEEIRVVLRTCGVVEHLIVGHCSPVELDRGGPPVLREPRVGTTIFEPVSLRISSLSSGFRASDLFFSLSSSF